mmetsp:Transcript_27764/g.5083  ORF Transcript_27764/g.5083 Transcript_27764/m.5083 type:complete len:88 (-) Transcript_27764:352-615(-)
MTLHIGWSVEGVVGSEYKIDPTYLSPNIQLGQDLLEFTKLYEVPILLTEQYYGYLTVKAKSCCRRIDTVQLTTPPNNNQFGLFTYDF